MADEADGSGSPASGVVSPEQFQFHMEEYRSLRAELNSNIRSQFDAYIYALVFNGGIVAWLVTHRADLDQYGPYAMKAAALLPVLVTLLAYLWVLYFGRHMQTIGLYSRRVEQRLAAPGLGWESFLAEPSNTSILGWKRSTFGRILWQLLLGAGLLFVVLV